MKRLFILLVTGVLLVSLTACQTTTGNFNNSNIEYMTTSCTKDSVDEFMSIIGNMEFGGLLAGVKFKEKNCYNVTPSAVAEQTDIKIFKFNDSCLSFALIDDEVYPVCESSGGYGFINAVPWDYDLDGKLDLLVASSWGSGLHHSVISVFNARTKETIVVYDTLNTFNASTDLFVAPSSPSFVTDAIDVQIFYQVYSANIEVNDNNIADLSYTATGVVGSIVLTGGVPTFVPISN